MDPTLRQQIVERLQQSTNVLITVGTSPTVDELASAIGLTLLLNKMNKHATTVFSGAIPSTIEFLQPEKTIENNTNSLRDFIIALDKSKADKLRYKVEDDVVRIFITPYRTSLSQNDLEFSQGDFNVEAVVAIGVSQKEELDQAITAHGRILHDATVMTITKAGMPQSDLGAINLHDETASSFCEIVLSIGDGVQTGLLDGQIATSFLTGIVAETDRFKNEKTTPRVLNLSAQLMAAGANQQLIAEKLDAPVDIPQVPTTPAGPAVVVEASPDGELDISHDDEKEETGEIHIDEHGNMAAKDDSAFPEIRHEGIRMQAQSGDNENEEGTSLFAGFSEPSSSSPAQAGPLLPSVQEASADAFMGSPAEEPAILSHQTVLNPIAHDEQDEEPAGIPVPEPAQVPEPVVEQPPIIAQPAPTPVVTAPEPVVIAPTPEEPKQELQPVEDQPRDDTLTDLEKAVNSPHLTLPSEQPAEPATDLSSSVTKDLELATDYSNVVDDARDAVSKATNLSEPVLEPVIALGTQPLSADLHASPAPIPAPSAPITSLDENEPNSIASILASSSADGDLDVSVPAPPTMAPSNDSTVAPVSTPAPEVATDPSSPPPVPPPMMPQFFESDGQHSNPFLNPNDNQKS